jgi:hypothetical protein
VAQPDSGLFFQQRHGEDFPVGRSVPGQGTLVDSLHQRGQLEGHVMLTAQRSYRREFPAAAVQPEAGHIITGGQRAEAVAIGVPSFLFLSVRAFWAFG